MINKKIIIENLFWRFLGRSSSQAITFIVSIILARLLTPELYGTIALIIVITSILQVFIDSGLGNALIQKIDADYIDFSTIFYFNILVCSLLYALLYYIAPYIAIFYKNKELVCLVRVVGTILIISGLRNVQLAYISRHLLFKKYFIASLFGSIFSGIGSIFMAYNKYEIWALAFQTISGQIIITIILWLIIPWRPSFVFSFQRLIKLFSFGWKLLASSFLGIFFNDIRKLIIGKLYTKEDLAFFNQGNLIPNYIISNINSSIDSVIFPVMSKLQNKADALKIMIRRSIQISSFLIMPLMTGLAVCSRTLIHIVLTDKWLPCIPYLYIYCFTFSIYPIHTANLNAIKAQGRSDIFLKLDIIKNTISLIALLITMKISVMAMAYSLIITSILNQLINTWPNKKILNYSYMEQIKDVIPSIISSLIMGVIVYFIQYLFNSSYIILISQIFVGVIVYLIISIKINRNSCQLILTLIKNECQNGR